MDTLHSITQLRLALDPVRRSSQRIAVVPTMGNLHEGHLSLVEKALERAELVVATIFVNPMQFGANEDLDNYPRTLSEDQEKLQAAGCHLLFAPNTREIYPEGLDGHSVVHVPVISELHCGASRAGHFDGVTTVVCKLLNIVQPDIAVFGLKDYQQFQVVRKMIDDLCLAVELIGVETRRDSNGLALSSRNGYLDDIEKDRATRIYGILREIRSAIEAGHHDYRKLEADARTRLAESGLTPDYFAICNAQTLQPANRNDDELIILTAAWVKQTRLIDNIRVSLRGNQPTGDVHVHQ